MLLLRRPTNPLIRAYLDDQARAGLTYADVGATAATPPPGYVVDHTRIQLGEGEEIFRKATAALRRWDQFRLGWVEALPADTPIERGAVVAILARVFGIWWLNACRIVYVIEQTGPISRFGFAYGTLPDHAGSGEERFLIEWDRERQTVWYDVLAFSKPRHVLARAGYPYMRQIQRGFGRQSASALILAIQGSE